MYTSRCIFIALYQLVKHFFIKIKKNFSAGYTLLWMHNRHYMIFKELYMDQNRLLRLPEVIKFTKLSRSTIYANIQKGLFPKPYKPSHGVSAWKECEIIAQINGEWKKGSQDEI